MARSGHLYDDRSGVSYEYPTRYRNLITSGDSFVYHRPRIGYVGCGLIGEIKDSTEPGRLVCAIESPVLFDRPVHLKDSGGQDFEAPMSKTGKVFYQQGVRPITEQIYERIVESGAAPAPELAAKKDLGRKSFATPADAREVDSYAVAVAVSWLSSRYPGEQIEVMPHNNPGFDIRVGPTTKPRRYVEVKGTRAPRATFFMSEGERLFSLKHAAQYSLLVIVGVDLMSRTHSNVVCRDGGLDGPGLSLAPHQWSGMLTQSVTGEAEPAG